MSCFPCSRLHLRSSLRASWDQAEGRAGVSHEIRGCKGQFREGSGKSTIHGKACTLQMYRGAWLPASATWLEPQHSSSGCKEKRSALGPAWQSEPTPTGLCLQTAPCAPLPALPTPLASLKASFSSPHSLKLQLPRSHNEARTSAFAFKRTTFLTFVTHKKS